MAVAGPLGPLAPLAGPLAGPVAMTTISARAGHLFSLMGS